MDKITIIKLIAFIVLVFLIIQIISCHANAEDKYPLYVGKSAEDKRLEDPVYRHKQLMEQLFIIECLLIHIEPAWTYPKSRKEKCYNILWGKND